MKNNTPSPNVSSEPMKTFEISPPETARGVTTTRSNFKLYMFEAYTQTDNETPAKHTAIGDLITQWSQDEKRRNAIEDARRWIADEYHSEDGDTVRTLRLRKGWSQAKLAEEIGTSQPHIARIERGTENLQIDTCRRLSAALDIDMNTLNAALRRQEDTTRQKIAR